MMIWIDGAFRSGGDLPTADAGRFGPFETMAACDAGVALWPRHIARLQAAAEVKVEGLSTEVKPLLGPTQQRSPSNDCGDVSWKVPMVKFYYPANIPGIGFHHWAAGVALATSIAHKGALSGAKVLAASALDFLTDPALVAEAKASFAEELGGVAYRPLLPVGQEPPADLNFDKMEPFREKMRAHYLAEKPEFV